MASASLKTRFLLPLSCILGVGVVAAAIWIPSWYSERLAREFLAETSQLRWAILGMGLLFVLSVVAAQYIIVNRTFLKPLHAIRAAFGVVEKGDLAAAVPVGKTCSEITDLAETFNSTFANLRATIGDIAQATDAVASAATQISSSTEEMASGIQEQSARTVEIAAAMEEMSQTISDNSKNATLAADTARESKVAADQGGEAVRNTVASVRNIGSAVENFATSILRLNDSSGQIGEIITVINDIADQTNLLALNAAIEAARAGEQGRGFAVVADEVRKLAERTMKATKEIESKISQIQQDSTAAVGFLEEGTTAVNKGIEQAEQAGVLLDGIVDISNAVVDVITQMATASEEQAATSAETTKNVQAISTVTQQTANAIQETAHATDDLNRLSAHVVELLSVFEMNADRAHSSRGKKSPASSRRSREEARPRQREQSVSQREDVYEDLEAQV
jgi:methyl-accepting chemotaxis protein